MNHDAGIIKIGHIVIFAALFLAQLHDRAYIILGHNDGSVHIWLLHVVNHSGVREEGGVIHHFHIAIGADYFVNNVGRSGNQRQIIFALQALLDNVHVQQSQKAAAEAKAQGSGGFRLEHQGSIVQLQLFQRVAQIVVIAVLYGIQAAINHGSGLAIAWQSALRRTIGVRNSVAHASVAHVFDASSKEANLALLQLVHVHNAGLKVAHLGDLELGTGGHHANLHALFDASFHDADVKHHALVGIKLGVKHQSLQGCLAVAFGSRNALYNGLQHILNTQARLGTAQHCVAGINADNVLDFLLHMLGVGAGQINFIDNRDNFQIVVQGQIHIGQGLGFNALGSVNYQQCALAGRQSTGHLIGKVHVTGGIDKVQHIFLAIAGLVHAAHSLSLDSNTTLTLQIHGVQNLLLHFPFAQCTGIFYQSVSQRRFAMIYMGNNRKVADIFFNHRNALSSFAE